MQCANDRQHAVVLESDREERTIRAVCTNCARTPTDRIRHYALGESGMKDRTMAKYQLETMDYVFAR